MRTWKRVETTYFSNNTMFQAFAQSLHITVRKPLQSPPIRLLYTSISTMRTRKRAKSTYFASKMTYYAFSQSLCLTVRKQFQTPKSVDFYVNFDEADPETC